MSESPRHDLDGAIDRVAAKMVAAPDDPGLLPRTMAQLPQRTATPWFFALPVQMTAAVALLLVAFVYARPSREVTSTSTLPAAERVATESRPTEVTPQLVTVPGAGSLIPGPRSPIPDPRSLTPVPRSPIPDLPDHERSLPPVDAVEAIELAGIATPSIDIESAAAIKPIVLTELALDIEGDE